MKLDVNVLKYLSKDEFRVLTAVEMGMKNHEIVPAELVERIAGLKHGGTYKHLRTLLRHKLVHHDSSKYDGYRLTYMGYDFLAIKTFVNRGVIVGVGRRIGVGKESDIFEVATEDGTILAMKLHRLGRTSFRAVKSKRDYLRHRNSYNWLYLSRLAALKEFAFMKALQDHGFPVPAAVDYNRHCVLMSLVSGYPLVQVKQLQHPSVVFKTIIDLIVRLAEHGLIHCDFNEFNIMIDDDEKITMIDFPQMVSVSHRNAQMYFDRDVECIYKFFQKRFNSTEESSDILDESDSDSEDDGRPCFDTIAKQSDSLDKALAASGFTEQNQHDLEKFVFAKRDSSDQSNSDSDEDSEEPSVQNSFPVAETTDRLQGLSVHIDRDTPEASDAGNIRDDDGEANCSANLSKRDSNVTKDTTLPDGTLGKDKDDSSASDNDLELSKQLNKQRRRAILAAQGSKRSLASRNTTKDKGGRRSISAKMQMRSTLW
eukprot:TRINITY_DN2844_c0_g1_i1.p1 TRINITY_DN2844_c0_g1~~TRINITY_DN2844_c0_g1_i1.p1  ORF type:complete len:483 (+),score=101.20 TRINITY_DN2844_c0_g1_i1:176-1624(+)